MTRKSFFKAVLVIAIVFAGIVLTQGCNTPTTPSNDSHTFSSSTDQGHNHMVTISKTDVENPPSAGISLQTSESGGHVHTLAMTQAELQSVKNGNTVTVTASNSSGHTHTFDISKWY